MYMYIYVQSQRLVPFRSRSEHFELHREDPRIFDQLKKHSIIYSSDRIYQSILFYTQMLFLMAVLIRSNKRISPNNLSDLFHLKINCFHIHGHKYTQKQGWSLLQTHVSLWMSIRSICLNLPISFTRWNKVLLKTSARSADEISIKIRSFHISSH